MKYIGLLSLIFCPLIVQASSADSADQLVGLWGAERTFRTPVAGPLRIYKRADRLQAAIAGQTANVLVQDQKVSFSLPNNTGAYRGAFNADRDRITGHWIQAPGRVENYHFATPVDLALVADGHWRGEVTPFHESLGFYLLINKEPDGLINVIMRNPERNIGVNYRLDHLDVDEDSVMFYDSEGEIAASGTLRFAQNSDRITGFSVRLWNGQTYDFTRRTRNNAAGFYPRADRTAYSYAPPVQDADGWPIAEAASVGLRPEQLTAFIQNILDTEINSHRTPYIQDVVIARHGKLVLDEHFFGYHGDIAHDSRSAGKSITSMVVGAAVAEGALDVQDKVYELFPESTENPDPRKASLTVEHLLTMSSGLACDDNDDASPGNEGNMQYQGGQTDWLMFTLDLPMVRSPGAAGVYCSGGINLLTGVVSRASGVPYADFFRSRLAKPLGITTYHMNMDPLQRGYGGGGIRLRPRDFLKFGQTMLDNGKWQGRRVLPESWVEQSFTARSSVNVDDDYGYAWWRTTHAVDDKQFDSWSATGNGGQLIIVVPDYDLVMAFNGGNYNNFPTWIAWRDELMPALIKNAVQ